MSTGSTHRDPRSIITPDAFDVSEELLGSPLATPLRRLLAWPIDLAVIGFVTLVTSSFAMVLGLVAAIFFMRAGFKRTPVKGSVFGRAMRFSVGCLGLFIGIVTASVWAVFGLNVGFGGGDGDGPGPAALISDVAGAPFAGLFAGLASEAMFANVDDLQEAEDAVTDFIEAAEGLGVERDQMLDVVMAAIPDDAAWADEAEAAFTRLIVGDEIEGFGSGEDLAEHEIASIEQEVAAYSTGEALQAYASLLEEDSDDEASRARAASLSRRLSDDIAADTIAELRDRIEDLEDDRARSERQLVAAREELAQETSGGVFGTLRNFIDELGFGFGWASLYLTVFLSWWNGQTVGKRMMGLRVVRLDGEPITWWVAFERAGGYVAGLATGLLGFAQVYWDANRQGIHDRIVGTVVIVDGAERIDDWESAL